MSSNNKTLLLTPDFPPNSGGVARYLSGLAEYFDDEIFVVTNEDSNSDVFDSAVSYSIKREKLFFKYLWPRWFKSVWVLISCRNDYERVLVSHVIPFGTAALIAGVFTRKPYFVIVHGMDFRLALRNKWKSYLAGVVLRYSNKVITNSRALSSEVKERFDLTNVEVVYPSVGRPQGIAPTGDSNKVRLLTVSRLVERKGHDRVLGVLSTMKDMDGVEYHVVGDGPEGDGLKKQAESLGLDNVVFHGFVDDEKLQEMYSSSDIFVMPIKEDRFDKEGFGMVFLEAALHGLPSVTSKISGVDEAVLHEQSGLLIEKDVELEMALRRLVSDSDYRNKLGEFAKKRAVNEFSKEVQLSKLRSILYE
jgi:phosphatidyl-myo-inositol dimannoside synthase